MTEPATTHAIPDQFESQAQDLPARAASLEVASDRDYEAAGELLRDVKTLRKRIDEHYSPLIAQAYRTHRSLCDAKKEVDGPLQKAEVMLKGRMSHFVNERQRQARIEAAEREAAARRREEEARLEEAAALEAAGEAEAAEKVLDSPPAPAPPPGPLAAPAPKVRGVSQREVWTAEVTDRKALLAAVVEGRVPMAVVKIDQAWLNGQAKALKQELAYPGVKVHCRTEIAAGARS